MHGPALKRWRVPGTWYFVKTCLGNLKEDHQQWARPGSFTTHTILVLGAVGVAKAVEATVLTFEEMTKGEKISMLGTLRENWLLHARQHGLHHTHTHNHTHRVLGTGACFVALQLHSASHPSWKLFLCLRKWRIIALYKLPCHLNPPRTNPKPPSAITSLFWIFNPVFSLASFPCPSNMPVIPCSKSPAEMTAVCHAFPSP